MQTSSKARTASGAKAHQRQGDTEDRSLPYREWHRTLSSRCVATDVDLIEWRVRGGKLTPVAMLEITRMDADLQGEPLREYLSQVLARMTRRDAQAWLARAVAGALGVGLYIVVFTASCRRFHVYNLTARQGWRTFTEPAWRKMMEEI